MSENKAKVVTRTDASNQAILELQVGNSSVGLGCLVDWVEDQVVSSGGKENLAASLRSVNKALKAAESFGVVKLHKQVAVERLA